MLVAAREGHGIYPPHRVQGQILRARLSLSPTSIITDRPRAELWFLLPVLVSVSRYMSYIQPSHTVPGSGMVVQLYKWRWRGSGPNVSRFIYIVSTLQCKCR